jgi:cell division transport system permease protein
VRLSFVLSEIGIGLRRNLTMTIAVIVTVAISLMLVGAGLMLRQQTVDMKGFWYDRIEVSIFLRGDITDAQREALRTELTGNPLVKNVYYESKQDAYLRFKENFKDTPDLVANTLPDSLPESFRVKLVNPKQVDAFTAQITPATPGVEQVQDQKRLLAPLFAFFNRIQNGAYAIAIAALLAALILVGNTVRVAAFNRRRETGIMRLVGASRAFIQLPFLLEGAVGGLLGALLAIPGIVLVKLYLIDELIGFGNAGIAGRTLSWGETFAIVPILVVLGLALTSVASLVTLRRFLRV